jgi:6-phosphofructokinase 1
MNAAIRAVVRYAVPRGLAVVGIERGFSGLIHDQTRELTPRDVGGIIHQGGTMLKTSRCPEFKTPEGLERSVETLNRRHIDGLVVIGGDGSFRGALDLSDVSDLPIIGVPATIDNDVYGIDTTIGFDTAVNTELSAIDRIRDTALSHDRIFVVEVMGRDRGFLALEVGLTAGAGVILVPEIEFDVHDVCRTLRGYAERGKTTSIIVVAEGIGDTAEIVKHIETHAKFEVRFTKLGYIQRGGSPTARSRLLADLYGTRAVELILTGEKNLMVGIRGSSLVYTNFRTVVSTRKPLDRSLFKLAGELAV